MHAGKVFNRKLNYVKVSLDDFKITNQLLNTKKLSGDICYPYILKTENYFIIFFSVLKSIIKNKYYHANYYMISKDLNDWQAPIQLKFMNEYATKISCVYNKDQFHLVWESNIDVYYSSTADLKQWKQPIKIDVNAGRPKLTLINQYIYITYEKHESNTNMIMLAAIKDNDISYKIIYKSNQYITRPSNLIRYKDETIMAWSKLKAFSEKIEYAFIKNYNF